MEARLSFIRRLLTESPLIGGFHHYTNFSQSYYEIKENMIGALLWPVSVPCGAQHLDAVQLALEGIDEAKRLVHKTPGLRIVDNADEMELTHNEDGIGVLLGLEGGHSLGSSLAVLRMLHSLGIRFVSLTSSDCTNPWVSAVPTNGESVFDADKPNTLSNFGQVYLYSLIQPSNHTY